MHGLCSELEFNAFAVDFVDDMDALVAGRFGVCDVVFDGARHGFVVVAQDGERTVDVKLIADDDAHPIKVVEFLGGGEAFTFELFVGAFDGFHAVVDGDISDARIPERLGYGRRTPSEPLGT